jgi:hypothetical protein
MDQRMFRISALSSENDFKTMLEDLLSRRAWLEGERRDETRNYRSEKVL